jgi:7,8-dihydroneopterin aldolase/epimerase/oxygenase
VTDTITIEGLKVFAHHGVLDHEKRTGQLFFVDVTVHLDLIEAGATDLLGATVDYGDLAVRVHDVVAGERWDLIERVAQRVADVALEDPRCQRVDVAVHKPDAPIPLPFADVVVRISRSR